MVQWLVAYKKQHRHPRVCKDVSAPWPALLTVNGPVTFVCAGASDGIPAVPHGMT